MIFSLRYISSASDGFDNIAQRQVNRRQHHLEPLGQKCHRDFRNARKDAPEIRCGREKNIPRPENTFCSEAPSPSHRACPCCRRRAHSIYCVRRPLRLLFDPIRAARFRPEYRQYSDPAIASFCEGIRSDILSNSKGIPKSAALDCKRSQLAKQNQPAHAAQDSSWAARRDISGPIPAGSPVVIPS